MKNNLRSSAFIRVPILSCFAASLALLLAACAPASAPLPAAELPPAVMRSADTANVDPGNYCVACHTVGDERLARALVWNGSIEAASINPCPAATAARQEVYYTERMLLALDRLRSGLPRSAARDRLDLQVAAARQTYSRLLDTPLNSLDAFTAEAQSLRYRLGKIYAGFNQLDAAARRDRVLLIAGLITLFLLISLAWGWRNTLRITNQRISESTNQRSSESTNQRINESRIGESRNTEYGIRTKLNPQSLIPNLPRSWRVLVLIALTLIFFSLPLFRVPPAEVATPSAEEQARQTALDTANRMAAVADRGHARAWMLGRVAAALARGDRAQGEAALTEALAAAATVRDDAVALWGEGQAVQEAAVGSLAAQEKALLIADALAAAQNRTWALRLIAEEWLPVDPKRAEDILQQALAVAANPQSPIPNTYTALDLRGLAVTWAKLDKAKGLELTAQVADPALRAWAYREIAAITRDESIFRQAADAARAVADPIQRSRALAEIAARTGNKALWDEALTALNGVPDPARSHALARLAVAGYPGSLDEISPAFPAERSLALLAAGNHAGALAEAAKIADPTERNHALARIAIASGDAAIAGQITDPTLADRARRDIASARGDAVLAQSIASPYERVQALTALGQYAAALAGIENLRDTYPLRALAAALARSDPKAALALVDKMEREADKAEALRALSAATGDAAIFDRALGMALAARVRNDALAPAEASLALAREVKAKAQSERALAQALDIAQRISVKYK